MSTRLVIPCYNEDRRLQDEAFLGLLATSTLDLLFVDDGSTDDTSWRLDELRARGFGRVSVLTLERNFGKAEAVRRGMIRALEAEPHVSVVGYFDADLATPTTEVVRLVERMDLLDADVLLASRVSLLGRDMQRSTMRHYLGRIFASAASVVLKLPVYDTQCGAKLFRRSAALSASLQKPFISRWAFDVELLGRLLTPGSTVQAVARERIVEEPLFAWRDVPGSKLRARHMAGAAIDLGRIARDLSRRRR